MSRSTVVLHLYSRANFLLSRATGRNTRFKRFFGFSGAIFILPYSRASAASHFSDKRNDFIYDAYLLEIEDNVFVGGDAFVNCHLFEGGFLKLGKIILKEGASVGARAYLTPGTIAEKDSQVGMHTYLRRNTTISEGGALITPPGMSMRQAVKIMRMKGKGL